MDLMDIRDQHQSDRRSIGYQLVDHRLLQQQLLHNQDQLRVDQQQELQSVNQPVVAVAAPFDVERILSFLPPPSNDMEHHMFETVKTVLKNEEVWKLFIDTTITQQMTIQEVVRIVFTTILNSHVAVEQQEALRYYMSNFIQPTTPAPSYPRFDFLPLLTFLPEAIDEEEQHYLEVLRTFFTTEQIYLVTSNIDVFHFADQKVLLQLVLKRIADSKVDQTVIAACNYYLNYGIFASLQFAAKKEVVKKFALTDIFIDTLDVAHLPSEARGAFKKFFRFLSLMSKAQMNGFTQWSDVKTRGEFVGALFAYLRSQSYVPAEILQAIEILIPQIRLDGNGALPP